MSGRHTKTYKEKPETNFFNIVNIMKMLKSFAVLAAMLTLSLMPAATSAQTTDSPETGVLQRQLDSLTRRLNTMEKKSSRWDKLLANLPQISGYGQMGYEWNGTTDAATSSFSVMSVRLSLAGDIGRKFDYKFQFELASPKLIDAYVRYKINPGFNLQAGQFHTNFSLEGPMSPLDMEAIDYAPRVKAVACQTPDTRDIGIAAYGAAAKREGYSIFEYSVGLFNGEGKNKLDLNRSKDVIARVKINPLKELTLSGSFGYGERGDTYVHNTRYAAGLWWHGENFYVRSEYLGLRQNDWANSAKHTIDGCYAVAGYWIKKFCPLVRYNYMDSDLSGTSVKQSDYLVGLDYKPMKYLRLQANYTRTQYKGVGGSNIVGLVVTGIF